MLRWIASALFLAIWVALLAATTMLDLHNAFIFAAQPNPVLTFPAYWIYGGPLVLLCAMTLLPLWVWGYQPILRFALALGVGWLLVLPFTPSTAEKALLLQGSRIQIGMSNEQVEMITAGYQPFRSGGSCGSDDVCSASCMSMCDDATVEISFVSGRVTSVRYVVED